MTEQAAEQTNVEKISMDATEIQNWIPHRYPFMLIDRVLELVPDQYIIALKNVTMNEEFFQGHFPHKPVMPGVLILEAMAQAAAVFARYSSRALVEGKTFYLVGADGFKWKRQVVPGDALRIEMRIVKKRNPLLIMEGECTVDGKVVAVGTLTAAAA